MSIKKIFNPFDSISSDSSTVDTNTSTSALYNEQVGVCPKCKTQMSTAHLPDPIDVVFFCPECRVSSPMPNVV